MQNNILGQQKFGIMVLGQQGTGKTQLINCLTKKPFNKEHWKTIGQCYSFLDFQSSSQQNQNVKVKLWDTQGDYLEKNSKQKNKEQLKQLISQNNIIIIIMVYSPFQKGSLEACFEFKKDFIKGEQKNINWILVGTKLDLEEDQKREYNKKEVQKLATENEFYVQQQCNQVCYVECSAELNQGIEKLYDQLHGVYSQLDTSGRLFLKQIESTQTHQMYNDEFMQSYQQMFEYGGYQSIKQKRKRDSFRKCTIF